MDDRIRNLEAKLFGFIVEHNLLLSMSKPLTDLAQEFSNDKEALERLSMNRTTALYKLIFSFSKTVEDAHLEELLVSSFSLYIDEAMN